MQIKGHVDEALGKGDRIWVSGDVDLPLLVGGGGRVVAPADPDHRTGHLPDLGDLGPALPDHRPDQLVGDGHLESRLPPLDPRSKSTFLAVPDLVPADLAPGNTRDRRQGGAAISETKKAGDWVRRPSSLSVSDHWTVCCEPSPSWLVLHCGALGGGLEEDAADVVDALGDALPAPGHGDAPLSAPGQRVAGNLGSNLVRNSEEMLINNYVHDQDVLRIAFVKYDHEC